MKAPDIMPLWKDNVPYPAEDAMRYPEGMTHIIAHDGRTDILPFLHDVTITSFEGALYIAWYNSTDAEICGSSLIRGRRSDDGGKSWSEPFAIVGKIDSAEEHFVPANLFPHGGKLYATITEMTGKNMTSALYIFEKGNGDSWARISQIGHGFICNTAPLKMADGRWISPAWMPMKNSTPAFPAVLISSGDDITAPWEPVLFYDPLNPRSPRIRCPETTLRIDGSRVLAFVRNDEGPSWVFSSSDFGRKWSVPMHYPMQVGNSKIFAGELQNGARLDSSSSPGGGMGRKYLIYTQNRGYFERSLLVIAICEPGESQYSKVYRIFEGIDAQTGRGSKWFYPCACEQDGFLYVACTLQEPEDFRSAVIAKIPAGAL
ncbi:MAG: glycoside hydrolase [Bacteroidales bacterium]|jgi:hypothetical protein|nr:glycoside hydrolase [Bacteroidales bacterium]